MRRRFDHVDLRVRSLTEVRPIYEALLPALGFTCDATVEGWLQFEAADADITEFFGVTEDPDHVPIKLGLLSGPRAGVKLTVSQRPRHVPALAMSTDRFTTSRDTTPSSLKILAKIALRYATAP